MKTKITACLLMLAAMALAMGAQAQKRDTLLSFTGHWLGKTTFKADSNYITHTAVGGNIKVGKDGSVYIGSAGAGQFNGNMSSSASSAEQMETLLKQQLTNTEGFNEYHLYQFSEEEIEKAKVLYLGMVVPDGPPPGGTSDNPTYQQYNKMANWCIDQENAYAAIINFYEAHRKDKHFDYPPPPLADYFNCWGCNRPAQREFEQKCKDYDQNFFQPELDLLIKTIGLLRNLTLLGQTGGGASTPDLQRMTASLFKYSKQHPENNGPCTFLDAGKLEEAEAMLATRLVGKADQLAQDVDKQNNYNATIPAVREYVRAERTLLLAVGTDRWSAGGEETCFERCRTIVEKLIRKLDDKLETEHDLSYLADIPLLCSLSMQDQVLGGNGAGVVELVQRVSHYKLSLDLNVKVNLKSQVTQTAHLQGTADMVVELDTTACVRLVLSKHENGVFTANLLENTQVYPKCSPSYVGTHTYTMPAPMIILHFCNKGGADSLTLGTFSPKPASDGLWKVPCGPVPPMNTGINGLDGYFVDPMNSMKNAMNIKANSGAYQDQLQQMQAYAQQMQRGVGGGAQGAANIKSVMDMANNTAPTNLMNMGRLEVQITLNHSKFIIDQTIDAKKTNTFQQLSQLVEYGNYKVQLQPKSE